MPQLDNAPQILKALIDGKDPITGNELPDDSPLQHVKVLRAMLAALQSLEQDLQRSAKRALRPTNVGKSWSDRGDLATDPVVARGGRHSGHCAAIRPNRAGDSGARSEPRPRKRCGPEEPSSQSQDAGEWRPHMNRLVIHRMHFTILKYQRTCGVRRRRALKVRGAGAAAMSATNAVVR